jgi:hypothetical protein
MQIHFIGSGFDVSPFLPGRETNAAVMRFFHFTQVSAGR